MNAVIPHTRTAPKLDRGPSIIRQNSAATRNTPAKTPLDPHSNPTRTALELAPPLHGNQVEPYQTLIGTPPELLKPHRSQAEARWNPTGTPLGHIPHWDSTETPLGPHRKSNPPEHQLNPPEPLKSHWKPSGNPLETSQKPPEARILPTGRPRDPTGIRP